MNKFAEKYKNRYYSVDTVLIVDVYNLLKEAERSHYTVDIEHIPERLKMLVQVLGDRHRLVAIIPEYKECEIAFRRAGFIIMSDSYRSGEIMRFIYQEIDNLLTSRPRYLILVPSDPLFDQLAQMAIQTHTEVTIWGLTTRLREFKHLSYAFRRLEDLLPDIIVRAKRVEVYIDYENLCIGLAQKGIKPETKTLIEAIRTKTTELGIVVTIHAYADWEQLSKSTEIDIQRKLLRLGVNTSYHISRHGKNTADMEIANHVRDNMDRTANTSDSVDVFVLGTHDGDFAPIVKYVQSQGKRVCILGLRDGFRQGLVDLGGEDILYLDDHFVRQDQKEISRVSDEQFMIVMRTIAHLHQKKRTWSYIDQLMTAIELGTTSEQKLRQAVNHGLLTLDRTELPNTISLNLSHPDTYLGHWIYHQLRHYIDERVNKGIFIYIDTGFLHHSMSNDPKLKKLGICQSWIEVKRALDRAAATGVIVKKRRQHYKDPNKQVDTWWLSESSNY